jgi:hypothetical protein
MKYRITVILIVMAGLLRPPSQAVAEEPQDEKSVLEHLAGHLSWDFRILSYGIFQQPANSTQNPANRLLRLSSRMAHMEVRPDLRLSFDRLEFRAKPRFRLDVETYNDGKGGNQLNREDRMYLNEWLARLCVYKNLFVSYGRENLQWGPSFLFSPSNPFFVDNGRRNTYMEIPGMDFGRIVWLPDNLWSVSFIANTGQGENSIPRPGGFKRTYALKMDYTGREKYASFIISRKENSETTLGFYGGWTFTDAMLLYAECMLIRSGGFLYPVENRSPFGFTLERLHAQDSTLDPVLLFGGSYTFMTKGALAIEYAYYGPGYTGLEADRYYELRSRAAAAFEDSAILSGLGQQTLGMTASTGLRFLRRNYSMVQYSQPDIADRIDLTFRWTRNLDDGSSRFTSIFGCSVGNHMELFSVGTFSIGDRNKEFTSILDNQLQLGLQYTF